jgi:hypothetical protein
MPDAAAAAATAPGSIPLGNNGSNNGSNSSGDSSGVGRAHMVLKVPLHWDAVSDKPQYAAMFSHDMRFYYRCVRHLQHECELMTKLAGACGITRCRGYGIAEFTMPHGSVIPVHGLLLELSELGSLAQQLKLGTSSFAALSAAEA